MTRFVIQVPPDEIVVNECGEENDLDTFCAGLSHWGYDALLRAGIAAARRSLPAFEDRCRKRRLRGRLGQRSQEETHARIQGSFRIVRTVERYLFDSTDKRAQDCFSEALAVADGNMDPLEACFGALAFAAFRMHKDDKWGGIRRTLQEAVTLVSRDEGSRDYAERIVRQAIRDELVCWALGEGDPVRERVEGRAERMG